MLELRQQEDVGVAVQSVPQNPQLEFVVPLWLGTQRKLRVEAGYTHLTKQGNFLAPERWTVACGWVF